uniref:Uncharacterized protein n=1 Tax=Panagrolaimus sp. ES5 TaxID=591445 RepID=A0AC34G2F0_9BILA
MIVPPSKRARFLASYRAKQNWSLSDSIIYYMAKNPKNANIYLKLVKSCKHFFVKNPIIIVERLLRNFDEKYKWIASSENTVEKILKLPHFTKIDKFEMVCIPEKFDIDTFFKYIKKNNHTKFDLAFCDYLSNDYRNRIRAIIDEILAAKIHEYYVMFLNLIFLTLIITNG